MQEEGTVGHGRSKLATLTRSVLDMYSKDCSKLVFLGRIQLAGKANAKFAHRMSFRNTCIVSQF